MAVTIVNTGATSFTIDGVPYLKNFLSVVEGDDVKILNIYDSKVVLQKKTNYADYTVDGFGFASAILLQDTLKDVLFNRNNLGTDLGYEIVLSLSDFDNLIAGSTPGVWLVLSDITLDADKTLPVDVALEFRNTQINLGGFALTGSGTRINAGLDQVFDTNGALPGFWNVDEAFPEWFGAKADGVTDSSISSQFSVTYFKSTAFSVGTYKLTSIINVPASRSIHGEGDTKTIIESSTGVFKCDGNFISISDLELKGTNRTGKGIEAVNGQFQFKLTNLTISNFEYNTHLTDCWTFRMDGIYSTISNCNAYFMKCGQGSIEKCRIEFSYDDSKAIIGEGNLIYVEGFSESFYISKSSFQVSWYAAIFLVSGPSIHTYNIDSCDFEGNGVGITTKADETGLTVPSKQSTNIFSWKIGELNISNSIMSGAANNDFTQVYAYSNEVVENNHTGAFLTLFNNGFNPATPTQGRAIETKGVQVIEFGNKYQARDGVYDDKSGGNVVMATFGCAGSKGVFNSFTPEKGIYFGKGVHIKDIDSPQIIESGIEGGKNTIAEKRTPFSNAFSNYMSEKKRIRRTAGQYMFYEELNIDTHMVLWGNAGTEPVTTTTPTQGNFFYNFVTNLFGMLGLAGFGNSNVYADNDGYLKTYLSVGVTGNRPTLTAQQPGFYYFDTTLGYPIWWTGSVWVDSTGVAV